MKGLAALIIALVSGSVAVAIVAVDLQFSLEAELQYRDGEGWHSVDAGREAFPFGAGCATQDLRLVVQNGALFGKTVHVHVAYHDASLQRDRVVESAEWSIGRGEEQVLEFRVDDSAFPTHEGSSEVPKPPGGSQVWVNASVGDFYFQTCVHRPEAMA